MPRQLRIVPAVCLFALFACNGDDGSDTRHHPTGWAAPDVHGLATKLQTESDCRGCHGSALDGAAGPSCDACHPDGWREDCTFCHGEADDGTGSPPRDIDGATQDISFEPHRAHVTAGTHPGYGCATCHTEPLDVLTPGHLFDDDTPAVAEVTLSAGLSDQANYADRTCSEAYCHGTGQGDDGQVASDEAPLGCDGCHASADTPTRWRAMSGHHRKHLTDVQATCDDCHAASVDSGGALLVTGTHVDGAVDVSPKGVVEWNGNTCTGLCHQHTHQADEPW